MRVEWFNKNIYKDKLMNLKSKSLSKKGKLIAISISSLLVVLTVVICLVIKFDYINITKAERLSKEVEVISSIDVFGDGTVSFKVGDHKVNLPIDPKECNYYTTLNGKIVKSSFEEFVSTSLFNELKGAPNPTGNFLYYIVDNYTGSDKAKEYKTSTSSCRYSEVPEGYLIEIYNPNYEKGNSLVYFNSEGELGLEPIFEYYIDSRQENYQVIVPLDSNVDSIVKSLVDYLDKL